MSSTDRISALSRRLFRAGVIRYPQAEILRAPIADGGVVEALLINQPEEARTTPRTPVVVYFHSNVDTVDELASREERELAVRNQVELPLP